MATFFVLQTAVTWAPKYLANWTAAVPIDPDSAVDEDPVRSLQICQPQRHDGQDRTVTNPGRLSMLMQVGL